MRLPFLLAATALFGTSCFYVRPRHVTEPMGTYVQGLVGVTEVEPDLVIDPPTGLQARAGDFTAPLIGGVAQQLFDDGDSGVGVEGGFTFAYDDDIALVLTGGGTSTADQDTILADGFGGLFVQASLGEARLYAAGGAVVQYAEVDLEFVSGPSFVVLDDSAFGVGGYLRLGVEVPFGGRRLVGIGVRWVDTDLDVSAAPNIDLDETQLVFTITDRW